MQRKLEKSVFLLNPNMRFGRSVRRPILLCNSRALSSVSLSHLFTTKKDLVSRVTDILEKSNPIEPALDSVQHILSPQLVSFALRKPPSPQLAFRFFIWALKIESLRAWKYQDLIIDLLKKDGGFELYWETLEELKRCGVPIPSNAFLVLIIGNFQAGNAERSVESFCKMRDFECKPNLYTCNAILNVIVQDEFVLLAKAVYNQMLKLNVSPNIVTYCILIDGLCKRGEMQEALELVREMNVKGISPNNITYTILLSGLCQANRTHDAEELFRKLLKSGARPDMITFNALLNGFCKVGKIDEALSLLTSFENEGYAIKLNGYSCLIDGLFKARRFKEAESWFHKLCEENITPDLVLYTIMIRGFSEAGRADDALQLLQEMTERGVIPDTQCYNTLIKAFCDTGRLDKAKSLKLEISKNDCFPDTYTHTILICGMCRNGLVEEAKQIFEQMKSHGCSRSVATFNALIDGLCKVGRVTEAEHLYYQMDVGDNPTCFIRLSQDANKVRDPATLRDMIQRLCDSGKYLKAYRFLRKLVDNGGPPDVTTYNILINSKCKEGDMNAAKNLVKVMQAHGCAPDFVTYGTLIDGYYRAGREDDALVLLNQMRKKGCLPTYAIYISLMTWSCRKQKISVAFNLWIEYMKESKIRDQDAISTVEDFFERGEIAKAVRVLLEMDIKLNDFNLAPYTIWLIALCQARRAEEALEIFHALQECKVDFTSTSCAMLICSLCKQEDLDGAMGIFLYSMDLFYGERVHVKPRICNLLLIEILRSEKHKKLTFDVLQKLNVLGYDLHAYLERTTRFLINRQSASEESILQEDVQLEVASRG